jgi:hypothetical protein
MLWEALTSLNEVKSRLQESLLQQPEYRALLVIDHATSQLAEVLGSSGSPGAEPLAPRAADAQAAVIVKSPVRDEPVEAAPNVARSRDRVGTVPAAADFEDRIAEALILPTAATEEFVDAARAAPTPAVLRMVAAQREFAGASSDIARPAERVARTSAWTIMTLNEPGATDEPPPDAGGEERPASAAETPIEVAGLAAADELAGDAPTAPSGQQAAVASTTFATAAPTEAFAEVAETPVSGMAALYMSIGEASDVAPPDDRPAEAAPAASSAFARQAESSPALAVSSMAAAFYESVGDVSDAALADEDFGDAPVPPPAAANEPGRAPSGIDLFLSKAAQAAPAAKAPTPRNYLPFIAAKRLIQSRQ